ncbi:hypothetical protein L9F63_014713, partial [Diploptera punctata]
MGLTTHEPCEKHTLEYINEIGSVLTAISTCNFRRLMFISTDTFKVYQSLFR